VLGVSAEDLAKPKACHFRQRGPRPFVSNLRALLCCATRGSTSMPRRLAPTNRDEFHHNRRQARLQAAWQSQQTAATANATTRESASQEALAARALSW